MAGPFGSAQPIDLGVDIGAGYQQSAANKIAQAKVQQRKDYTSGYAGKYGVKDVAASTKGLSDTDLYEMATKLVGQRRGPVAAPAPAPKATAPKVKVKASKKKAAAPKIKAPSVKAKRPTAKRKTSARKPISAKEAAGQRSVTTAIQQAREAAANARGYSY